MAKKEMEAFKEETKALNETYKTILFNNRNVIESQYYDPGIKYKVTTTFIKKYLSINDYKEV